MTTMAEAARRRGGGGAGPRTINQLTSCLIGSWITSRRKARWREWMNRVEATIFAASEPVDRETLARVVGRSCSIDLLIDDIREELRGRPYDLVPVAGGWKHLTRPA